MKTKLKKRTWIYAQPPTVYGIALCKCGDKNPEWSEFKEHLWCSKCQIDFLPEHGGLFDAPIPSNTCELLGIFFHRINLKTNKFQLLMPDNLDKKGCFKFVSVNLKPKELEALKTFFIATQPQTPATAGERRGNNL